MENVKSTSQIFSRVAGILLFAIIIGAVAAVALSAAFLPTVKIRDASVYPYKSGDLVLCLKSGEYKRGDIVAFRLDDGIVVKRIAAVSGQWVDMDPDGNIYINNKSLKEPHASNIGQGAVTVKLPCQVPEDCVFVLSDDRAFDDDSRSAAVGCVSLEQITGRILFRLWS
jgi:signal peptidase I